VGDCGERQVICGGRRCRHLDRATATRCV